MRLVYIEAFLRQARKKPEENRLSFGQKTFRSMRRGSELVVHACAEDRRVIAELGGRNRAREELSHGRISDRRDVVAAEVGVEIFALDRDVVGDRVFAAAADRPADSRGAGTAGKEEAVRGVEHVEMRASAAVGDTTRGVDHEPIVRRGDEAQAGACSSEPVETRLGVDVEDIAREEPRSAKRGAGEVGVLTHGRSVKVGFDAEHEGARLPIVAGLAAANKSGALRSEPTWERTGEEATIKSRIRVKDRRVTAAAGPNAAGVQTDIEAGPGKRRRHEHRRRRLFSRRKVCSLRNHRPHGHQRHDGDALQPAIDHLVISVSDATLYATRVAPPPITMSKLSTRVYPTFGIDRRLWPSVAKAPATRHQPQGCRLCRSGRPARRRKKTGGKSPFLRPKQFRLKR